MSEKKRKTDLLLSDQPIDEYCDSDDFLPVRNESKKIRKISPLGFRVVVEIKRDSNISEGGLYLPEGAKQSMEESLLAEVIEVASAIDSHTDEETNVSGVPLGAIVLVPKNAGVKVPWDENLRIVETKDILAIVSEISII